MNGIFDCRACVERASDLVSGELRGLQRLVSRVHVALCKDCREHMHQLETTVSVVHAHAGGGGGAGEGAGAGAGEEKRGGERAGLREPGLDPERKRALMEALRAKR